MPSSQLPLSSFQGQRGLRPALFDTKTYLKFTVKKDNLGLCCFDPRELPCYIESLIYPVRIEGDLEIGASIRVR